MIFEPEPEPRFGIFPPRSISVVYLAAARCTVADVPGARGKELAATFRIQRDIRSYEASGSKQMQCSTVNASHWQRLRSRLTSSSR